MENAGKKVPGSPNCAQIKLFIQTSGIVRCEGDGIDIVREYFFPMGFQFGFNPRMKRNQTIDDPCKFYAIIYFPNSVETKYLPYTHT